MANFIECWGKLKAKDYRHTDKSEVLDPNVYEDLRKRIKADTDLGVPHVEAARNAINAHLGEVEMQLQSVYDQVGQKYPAEVLTEPPPKTEAVAPVPQPEPVTPPVEPPPPVQPAAAGVPQKPSKIGKSIEAKAVEAKLTQGFADTAGYDPVTIADQSQRATTLVQENLPLARSVVRGEAPLPEGLRGTSVITAMEEHLLKKPDARVAYELANSPLTSATSAAAQEMRLMGERVPDSITAKFDAIKRARSEGAKLRGETPAKVTADITKEVVKQASKRPTWEAFVRDIVCPV